MKRMKKLLAVILTASMLLGNTGPAYAAETMGGSTEEIAAEEQRSDSGSGQEAAEAEDVPYEESSDAQEEQKTSSAVAETASSAVTAFADAAAEASKAASTQEYMPEDTAGDGGTEDAKEAEAIPAKEAEAIPAKEAEAGETEEAGAEDSAAAAVTVPEEKPAAEAATEKEAAEEEKFTEGELTCKGSGYSVTMTYDADAKIPADAKLKVREIKKGTPEYESYLSGAEAVSDKGVAEARFFDITIWAGGKEVQPQSAVRVNITYNNAIEVADEGEVQAMHFEDKNAEPEVLATDTNNGSEVSEIAFDAESFSVYGIIYTVDFTYGGFTFSMPGEGSILLSDLAERLGLYETDLDKAFDVRNVSDVTFTSNELLKTEKQADGDWLLTSLAPFTTEETLTVVMKDGVKFVIEVTDAQESSNLVDFLANAVITGATQTDDGKYQVEAGKEYNIILSFAESSAHQFNNQATLTYSMPDGLTILSRQTGELKVNIVYKGRTYQIDATYDLGTDGNLQIKFDESDPDFHHLENTTNVSFRFSYNGAFDGTEDKIRFSEDLERDIEFEQPDPGQAYVSKSGTFDEKTGKFTYTITVEATGDITNVNVKDVISGNALIFNNDVRVTGNSSPYTDNHAASGFDYTFASMQEGEVITITYSASVDFSKDDDKDGKISVDQTKNTATVKPEDGEPHNSEYSHEIAFRTTKKSNGSAAGITADGDKIYEWKITYNELRLAPAAGITIKDTIAADSTDYMKYYGDGLSIDVIDNNGNIVDTRIVPYSELENYSDSTWTYKIPEGDTQPYMYEITYYTVVDMEEVEGTGNTVTVSNDANGSGGSVDVTPENVISVTKAVDSFTTEEVNWTVTLGVPENGLTQAVVTDSVPRIWLFERNIYDLFKDGSLEITGLLDGESYTVDTDTTGQVKITFYQDPGKRISGLKAAPGGHTITVKLTTLVDQDWLHKGYETGAYEQNHTNTVNFNGKTTTATVTFGEPGIKKEGEALKDNEGNVTGLKYTVVMAGVSDVPVSILDTFDTSILEVDTSKASEWDHMQIWGGNQHYQGSGKMPISYTDTGDGIILTADSVPMQEDGSYYPYYKIIYYLKVKDGVDLSALAIANGGEYDVDNTAKWGDHQSDFTYKVEYDYLDKKLLNEGELGGTSRTAKYQIVFNPSGVSLNDGENMTMTDVLSANLSIDYSSIKILTEPAGESVAYSLSGGEGGTTVATYTIPDSTKVTVTYEANVRGDGRQTIVNKVSVNDRDETVENTKSYGSASEGEGAQASFTIVKVDGYDANKKLQGVKFKVFCENPDVDFGGGVKELNLVTDENGEITLDGDTYTFYFDEIYHVQEVEAPEDYGTISFDYLVTLTNEMKKVDYGHYIYYYSDSMQIKNWPLEGLVVEKQVESDEEADKDRYYNFRISILNDDGSVNTDFNEKSGDDEFVNGVTEFRLKNKEQKMFWGFDKGTKYKVEEIFTDEEGNEFTTTVSYDVFDEEGQVIEHKTERGLSHTGTLTQEDEVIVFTNTRASNGSLKLKKQVTVDGASTTGKLADGIYEFTIKGPSSAAEAEQVTKTVTITVTNGVAASATVDGKRAALGSDGYVEVTDLAAGEYTISEKAPTNGTTLVGDNNKKVTVVPGETGADVTAKAEFTNNKPGTPTFEKKIQDTNDTDGKTSGWQDSADYDIGDAVPYKLTAKLPDDVSTNSSYSIKFEDQMERTLTFAGVSKVLLNGTEITNDCAIDPAAGGQSFTVSKSWTGDDITDALNGATVEVYFTATLNENAKLGAEGNVNAARLHYDNKAEITDNSGKTPWDYVIAFTYKLDISKVDQDDKALGGAEFKLEKKLADGTRAVVALNVSGNVFTGKGLDDGTYVLTETKAPTGYKPIDPIEFTVSAEHTATWDYISTGDAPAFNGEGRTGILTSLTGSTTSGDLVFDKEQSLDGLKGTVKNEKLGSLKIKKNVQVNGEPTTGKSADGTYTFVIKNEAGEEVTTAAITITDGKSNEVQVDNLPVGKYTVTEDVSRNPAGMTIVGENGVEVEATSDETKIQTAEFTNNKTEVGSLKIKKNVTVNGAATEKTIADGIYTFNVKDKNGVIKATETIEIKDGKSKEVQIDNLSTGKYTVSEDISKNPANMSLVGDNDLEVTVTADTTATVPTAEFTNNIDVGSLKIKKNVKVNGQDVTDTSADGDYTFTVKDAAGAVAATETIKITNGVSNEVRVDDLVPGTYTVSEDTSNLPAGMVLIGNNNIRIEVKAKNTADIPTAEFTNNKPGTPTFEKKIQDTNDTDGKTSGWQDSADYDIGDAVPYKLTAKLPDDVSTNSSYSIKFEDQMERTLTFAGVSKVLLNGTEITNDCAIDPAAGGQSFTVSKSWTGDDITDALNGATVEVYFTATLNENAKLGAEGNVNAARLHYDNKAEITEESGKTPWDYVIAFTYKLDINKVDQDGGALTGAEFKLEKKLAGGKTKEITLSREGNVFTGKGLDDGTYVLTETKAPTGYKPIDPIEFTVSAEHTATWDYTSTGDAPAFNGEGRTTILEALTGSTDSGDLEFADPQSPEGLVGTVTNQGIGAIRIEKVVTGTAVADKAFNFEIALTAPEGTTLDRSYPAKLNGEETTDAAVADGKVTVTLKAGQVYEITGLPAGTTYTVTEVAPLPAGYKQGTHTGTSGEIAVGGIAEAVMNNTYESKGEITLEAQKKLLGERTLEEGQFTFELKDADGNVIDSKTNAADGSVTFDAIKYTQDDIYDVDPETGVYSGADTKTYTYTINEVIPKGAKDNGDGTFLYNGYTYDGTVYTVKVVVTDNGDGTITAEVAGSEGEIGKAEAGTEGEATEGTGEAAATDYVFTNAYDAAGTLKLDAEKTFKNGVLTGGEFTFELKDADGNVLQSKKNDAAGNASFDLIAYSMKDLAKSPITYTVNEVVGTDTDVKYDETVYTVTVTLADNGDGTLSVTKKIDNGGALKFVNEQMNVETSITIRGVKVLKGKDLKAGQFKFVMMDENGKWVDSAENDADGNFTFGTITYKLSDLGGEKKKVFTYGISEVKGSDRSIIYDEKVHTVVVTVTDNGDGTMTATADKSGEDIKFVNTTRDKTGDEAPLGVLFGGFGIGAIGLAVLLEDRRRRSKKTK